MDVMAAKHNTTIKQQQQKRQALTTGLQSSCWPARVMSGLRWRGSSFVAGSILIVELLAVISLISSANSCVGVGCVEQGSKKRYEEQEGMSVSAER